MSDRDPIDLTDEPTPDELEALSRLLADPAVWDDPDPALEDAVVAAIVAEAAAAPAPFTAAPAAGARRRRARAGGPRPRTGWGLLIGASAAAVLIVAVALVAQRGVSDGDGDYLALQPSDRVASAHGGAHIEERADGTRIVLEVSDLPPAPAGTYYEAWLRKSPQVGVSAGTFHLRGGGKEHIELWAGVSPRDYPLFTVTLQDEGRPESSGKVFLSGRLG